jgi:chemotaxis protein CheX
MIVSTKVALIDFPRLQEQIATRLLAEHDMNAQRMSYQEAKDQLKEFALALFFWPDGGNDAVERFTMLEKCRNGYNVPFVIVSSEMGRRNAESSIGKKQNIDFLVTPLQSQIVAAKLSGILGEPKKTVSDNGHLDVAWVNPFITATLSTLKQMAAMDCQRKNLEIRHDARSRGDISGVMVLSGGVEGFVAITCPGPLARKIVSRMLQVEPGEETEEDIMDGIGEVMNMIAGAAKAELVGTKKVFQLNIPNVIIGGPHNLGQPRTGSPVVVITFETEGEELEVLVNMKERP